MIGYADMCFQVDQSHSGDGVCRRLSLESICLEIGNCMLLIQCLICSLALPLGKEETKTANWNKVILFVDVTQRIVRSKGLNVIIARPHVIWSTVISEYKSTHSLAVFI